MQNWISKWGYIYKSMELVKTKQAENGQKYEKCFYKTFSPVFLCIFLPI